MSFLKQQLLNGNLFFVCGLIFYLLFTLFTLHLPFYGDHVTLVSKPANFYFDTNFNTSILPAEFDTGHPPLYSFALAEWWKVFGKSLASSHMFIFFFIAFLFYQFHLLCKRLLTNKQHSIAIILCIFYPTLLAQVAAISTDILLSAMFLLGLNALLSRKREWLIAAVAISLLISLRGWMVVGSLFLIDLFFERVTFKLFLKKSVTYLLGILPYIFWVIVHFENTGWLLTPPASNWSEHRELVSLQLLWQKIAEYILRYVEFGMIIPWMAILFTLFRIRKTFAPDKKLLLMLIVPVLFFSIFVLPFRGPILIRYILPVQLIALIAFSKFVTELKYSSIRTRSFGTQSAITIATLLLFILHHFFSYPQIENFRIYYSWGDGSLAHLKYFKFRDEGKKFFEEANIPPSDVYTAFPENMSFKYTHLQQDDFHYNKINFDRLANYRYIIYSNVMNDIPLSVAAMLKENWVVVLRLYHYPVEYVIFRNIEEAES